MSERFRAHTFRFVAGLALLALMVGVTACGGGGGIEGGGSTEVSTVELEAKPSGELTISNWPLYIDKNTIPEFEKETGVSVKYIEDINSPEEYFNKMQPLLAKGESGGRSLMMLPDYTVAKMHELGYVQELDKSAMPNVEKNLIKTLRHPSFDPERSYTVPWASGMTGLIVNKDLAPEIKGICDLFDPKYKGKVEFLNEARETVPLVMKCEGVDPDTATEADWMKAIDKTKAAAQAGQIRRFTGNEYVQDLLNGNVVAAMGWSGDGVQLELEDPKLEWRMPTEGCLFWSENAVVPVGAPNPTAAEAFMNYVYDPQHQAQLTETINVVSPVEGVRPIIEENGSDSAKMELIFPSSSFTKKCSTIPILKGEEEQNILQAFDGVLNE